MSSLLPHEFVHSWNGKFRRPAGLATGGFDKPMRGELLWVYEGLTNYLGWLLAARSGLAPADWAREDLASTAAQMAARSGRKWRPLVDTAVSAQLFDRRGSEWTSWRRSTDYYPEGTLLWLDIDVTLRAHSGNKKSLDDFCRAFYGGPNKGPEVKPYTLDDVVKTLSAIDNSDWARYFHDHVYAVAPLPPDAIAHGGWRLYYDEQENERLKAISKADKVSTLIYSLGFSIKEDGSVLDVAPGSPAAKGGLAPAMKVLGVDGRKLIHESFDDALTIAKSNKAPIELLVLNADAYRILKIDYHEGKKYPHVQPQKGAPDLLNEVVKPLQTAGSPTK
jgi:predicted metalloprotease with PDZ domain